MRRCINAAPVLFGRREVGFNGVVGEGMRDGGGTAPEACCFSAAVRGIECRLGSALSSSASEGWGVLMPLTSDVVRVHVFRRDLVVEHDPVLARSELVGVMSADHPDRSATHMPVTAISSLVESSTGRTVRGGSISDESGFLPFSLSPSIEPIDDLLEGDSGTASVPEVEEVMENVRPGVL